MINEDETRGLRENAQANNSPQPEQSPNEPSPQPIPPGVNNIQIPHDEQVNRENEARIQQEREAQASAQNADQEAANQPQTSVFERMKLLEYNHASFITNAERKKHVYDYMTEIKTTGCLGLKTAEADKSILEVGQSPGQSGLPGLGVGQAEKNELMELDGIYLTKADVEMNTDNVRRLEQRLINAGKTNYFRRDNRELKLETTLFENKLYRRTDISILKNNFQNTIKRNAVICERLNQKKKTYYRMDMALGKMQIDNHPLFGEEDKCAAQLKQLMKAYREKVEKGMLAHHQQVLEIQQESRKALTNKANISRTSEADLALIDKQIQDTEYRIKLEKNELLDSMNDIYQVWKKLKLIRLQQGYTSTSADLVVQEYTNDLGKSEQYLLLRDRAINEKNKDNGQPLPSAEMNRRSKIKGHTYYLKIYVNGLLMTTTQKEPIDYPSMEVDFRLDLQVFVYTKPYSISIEVCSGGIIGEVLDKIEIDIPGEHANSLTSASTIYRNLRYEKKKVFTSKKSSTKEKNHSSQQANPNNPPVTSAAGTPPENSLDPVRNLGDDNANSNYPKPNDNEIDRKTTDEMNTQLPTETDIDEEEDVNRYVEVIESGSLTLEIGWPGFGPIMPPLNTGGFGIFRQKKKTKDGYKELSKAEDELMTEEVLIDINDPRNIDTVEKVREIRNNKVRNLLQNDVKIPLHNIDTPISMFHKLSHFFNSLKQQRIPLLNEEFVENQNLVTLLRYYDKKYMSQMNEEPDEETDKGAYFLHNLNNVEGVPRSQASAKRLKETIEKAFKLQNEVQLSKSAKIDDIKVLDDVIAEFKFIDKENQLLKKLMQLFEPNRKLRKVPQALKKVRPKDVKKFTLGIQVIKALNVPGRFKESFHHNLGQSRLGRSNFNTMNQFPSAGQTQDNVDYDNPRENRFIESKAYDLPSTFIRVAVEDPAAEDEKLEEEVLGTHRNATQLSARSRNDDERNNTLMSVEEARMIEAKTGEYSGVDPEWNEFLNLVYKNPSNQPFTTSDLLKSEAFITVTLFDKRKDKDEDNVNPHTIIFNIENYFMGNIKIPVTGIIANHKMDSMFKINRPLFLFGYVNSVEGQIKPAEADSDYVDPFTPTYLMMSMSCEPAFELPSLIGTDYHPGYENTQFLVYGKAFLDNMFQVQENQHRNLRVWGYNLEGKSVFISRYLKPLSPPEEFFPDSIPYTESVKTGRLAADKEKDIESIYQKCARFVSLIPLKGDTKKLREMPDIFMTCQEFLDLIVGDFEEHAFLLCNYFMFLDEINPNQNYESMVVMGRGVPEGKTYYVLRRHKTKNINELWNPVTGDNFLFSQIELKSKFLCFSISAALNNICPLKYVDAIVTRNNVLINIQKDKSISSINWDIHNLKNFQPFMNKRNFDKFFPNGQVKSIQQNIIYEKTNIEYVNRLSHRIELYISMKFEDERNKLGAENGLFTKWNFEKAKEVKNYFLTTFEVFKYCKKSSYIESSEEDNEARRTKEELSEFKKVILQGIDSKDIYGFPLNMPFTSVEQIWEEVKATDIHKIMAPNVEFILSVGVIPYPNNILSVWVFIAILKSK